MLLIAHRGDTINHKENTIDSFLSAFEKGANGIEFDVHLFDGKIIIVHNFLFDRNQTYPLLQDVLAKICDEGRIEIEVKEYDSSILSPLKAILDKYPKSDFELTTSEIPLAAHIKKVLPDIRLGLIMNKSLFEDWMTPELVTRKLIGWGRMSKSNVLHIPMGVLTQFGGNTLVKAVKESGFVVHSHILKSENEKSDLELAKSYGVDQCTVDNINLISR